MIIKTEKSNNFSETENKLSEMYENIINLNKEKYNKCRSFIIFLESLDRKN